MPFREVGSRDTGSKGKTSPALRRTKQGVSASCRRRERLRSGRCGGEAQGFLRRKGRDGSDGPGQEAFAV